MQDTEPKLPSKSNRDPEPKKIIRDPQDWLFPNFFFVLLKQYDISWPPYLQLAGGKLLKFNQLFSMLLAKDGVMMAQCLQLRSGLIQLLLQLRGPLVGDLELRNVSGVRVAFHEIKLNFGV
jgi:hypothetical protein